MLSVLFGGAAVTILLSIFDAADPVYVCLYLWPRVAVTVSCFDSNVCAACAASRVKCVVARRGVFARVAQIESCTG